MSTKKSDSSSTAVRLAAGVTVVLMVIFFSLTLKNMFTVSSEVSDIQDGPYPVSIAAGHIETNLARLETIVQSVANAKSIPDNTDIIADRIKRVDDSIQEYLDTMNPGNLDVADQVELLKVSYAELVNNVDVFIEMCAQPGVTRAELESYFNTGVSPLIHSLIFDVNNIIDQTAAVVNQKAENVTFATNQTVILSSILMAGVILVIFIYVVLIVRKDKRELELRENLQEALVVAENASDAKTEFLSNMSHDMRTPLNAIVGLTDIANDNIDNPLRVKQCLTRITTSSRHLLSLINDILDMNKIESGKVALNEERFSLPELTAELINIVEPQAQEKNLKTDYLIYNIVYEDLIGDAMRVRQILLNLVSNAVKYTEEGDEVRVSITEDEFPEDRKTMLQIVVEDTGIGMDAKFLENVFDPFEREQNDYTNFTEGSGLGLAITKNLVDLMGGTIKAQSTRGEGTVFTVRIPMFIATFGVESDGEGKAEGSEASDGYGAEAVKLSGKQEYDTTGFDKLRVLVVDDNHIVAQNALSIIRDFGATVHSCNSGNKALLKIEDALNDDEPFDLAIIDLSLPEMDGVETVRQIKERLGDKAPKVVLSAYVWSDLEEKAREEGIETVIHKPMFRSRIYEAIRKECMDKPERTEVIEVNKRGPVAGRVLIVDDNEINLEIGVALVERLGPEVETASDGVDALQMVRDADEGYYDLILMDCKMPRMNGFEATKAINKFCSDRGYKQIPIIAMTANAFKEDEDKAYSSGMVGFIPKPINVRLLEENLRRFLPEEGEEIV